MLISSHAIHTLLRWTADVHALRVLDRAPEIDRDARRTFQILTVLGALMPLLDTAFPEAASPLTAVGSLPRPSSFGLCAPSICSIADSVAFGDLDRSVNGNG